MSILQPHKCTHPLILIRVTVDDSLKHYLKYRSGSAITSYVCRKPPGAFSVCVIRNVCRFTENTFFISFNELWWNLTHELAIFLSGVLLSNFTQTMLAHRFLEKIPDRNVAKSINAFI